MKVLLLLTILSVSCALSERICKTPEPKDKFSLKKFSGEWYIGGFDSYDPFDIDFFEDARCGRIYFHLTKEKKIPDKWEVDLPVGESGKTDVYGPYYLPDPRKGLLKTYSVVGNFTYDYTVLCSDYKTWTIAYACAYVTPSYVSEFDILLLRNLSQYDEVITYDEPQKCLNMVSQKKVKDIQRIPAINCSADFYLGLV